MACSPEEVCRRSKGRVPEMTLCDYVTLLFRELG